MIAPLYAAARASPEGSLAIDDDVRDVA